MIEIKSMMKGKKQHTLYEETTEVAVIYWTSPLNKVVARIMKNRHAGSEEVYRSLANWKFQDEVEMSKN